MVKLLMLITSLAGGGAERTASELSLNLGPSLKQRIVTLTNRISYSVNKTPICLNLNPSNRKLDMICALILGVVRYRRILDLYNPDVSLSFLVLDNLINILSNIGNKKTKVIASVHVALSMKFHGSTVARFLIRIIYNRAYLVIAVSQGVKQELIRDFKINPLKIRVLYNPVDVRKIQDLAHEDVKDEWFNVEVPILINVGRLSRQKGQWHLIRAFSKVRQKKKCNLVIRGIGDLKPYLEKLIKDLDLANDVRFLGWQDNPFKYLSKAAVFVSSSLWEALPCSLIEAMACGCPVVAVDCKYGPSEILGKGKFGILTPPMDGRFYKASDPLTPEEECLANGIIRLFNDEKLRRSYSEKARQRAMDFDRKITVRGYENIINEYSGHNG